MSENRNEIETIDDIVNKYRKPEIVKVESNGLTAEVLVLPEGLETHSVKKMLDEYLPAPERLRGNTELTTAESFKKFVERFKNETSALFYNKERTAISCVFDFSQKDKPQFEQHTALYNFPLSKSWKNWMAKNKQGLNQLNFVEHIEDNINDLCEPLKDDDLDDDLRELKLRLGGNFATVAKMVELSRGIKINVDERAVSKINNSTGEVTIEYATEHKDGKTALKLPNLFMVMVQVLENGKYYKLPCHLRYRMNDGRVVWYYEVINADKAIEHAVKEELADIEKSTELPLFYSKR